MKKDKLSAVYSRLLTKRRVCGALSHVKAAALIFVFLCAAVFTGCSLNEITGKAPEAQIKGAYNAECSVTAYIVPPDTNEETEFKFDCKVKRLGTGFWEMDITAPDTVCGMKITASDGSVSSQLDGFSISCEQNDVPAASPVFTLFKVLDSFALTEAPLESGSDGGWMLKTEDCTMIFDSAGAPVSLAASNPKITVSFTSFTVITSEAQTVTGTTAPAEETAAVTSTVSEASSVTSSAAAAETTAVQISEASRTSAPVPTAAPVPTSAPVRTSIPEQTSVSYQTSVPSVSSKSESTTGSSAKME